MRKIFILTILSLLSLIIISQTVYCARSQSGVLFLLIGPGARATGMGEAFTAVANDPTATYWNPAGLGRQPLSSYWKQVTLPKDQKTLAFGLTKGGGFSEGFRKFNLWLGTNEGLYKFQEEEWVDYEEEFIYDSQTVWKVLQNFYLEDEISGLPDYMPGKDKVISLLNQYNGFQIKSLKDYLPPETEVKIPLQLFVSKKITAMSNQNPTKQLWIGTESGVMRRSSEGMWVKMDRRGSSPGDKEVTCISNDGEGNTWIGTNSALYLYKPPKWYRYSTVQGLPSNEIKSISVVSSYKTWVGTDRGPAKFNGKKWTDYYYYHLEADQSWKEIAVDIFGSANNKKIERQASKLMAYNHSERKEITASPEEEAVKIPFKAAFESPVTAIYEQEAEKVWFGTDLGIKKFDGKKWHSYGYESRKISDNRTITDFVEENWPKLSSDAVKSLVDKIKRYNYLRGDNLSKGDKIQVPVNATSSKIYVIHKGSEERIFFGSEYGGLTYDPKKEAFRYYTGGGLNEKQVESAANQNRVSWFRGDENMNIYTRGEAAWSMMHTRWLPKIAEDIYYSFLASSFYIEGWGTVGFHVIFISEGKNVWTSETGLALGEFKSYETSIGASYGTKLFEDLSLGLTFKFLYSQLAPGGISVAGRETQPATSFAVDFGLHYEILEGFNLGASVQNIGPPVQYIDAHESDPLPRNLKLGLAYVPYEDRYSKLLLSTDIHKGLVDFGTDSLQREFRKALKCLGAEYTYSDFISLRAGYLIDYDYHYEPNIGDWVGTNYFSFGIGLKYSGYKFNFSYLPEQVGPNNTSLPLSNIMRISLNATF